MILLRFRLAKLLFRLACWITPYATGTLRVSDVDGNFYMCPTIRTGP